MQYSQRLQSCQPQARRLVDEGLYRVQRLLWPSTCVLCRISAATNRDLCAPCEGDLPLNPCCCTLCAQPLFAERGIEHLCGMCLRERPRFDTSFVPFRYSYPLDRMIQRLKYAGELPIGRLLGDLFAQRLKTERSETLPEVIIPVPLAARRFRSRGYNQASELGRRIAKHCGIELRADVVERTRETLEQAALARAQRRKNVRGAFEVIAPLPYSHVAVLDDVVTTGSTVNELAKVLRKAGAKRIEVWAIARAGR
jgi:ComF family protein